MKITTKNLEETLSAASLFAKKLVGGDIVLLSGELGAGKTTFTKGLAEELGVVNEIKSPTFTLMNVYRTKKPTLKLVHIDTYRMENEKQLVEIGVEDYLGKPDTITVIEWPEKILELLKNKKVTEVKLRHSLNNQREIELPD